jgi:hypothetical protein
MAQKKTLADITGPRYRKAGRTKKSAILDEFCQTAGYNRKYAITLLRHAGKTQLRHMGKKMVKVKITVRSRRKRVCQKIYDEPVEQAVLAIWDFFRHVCGKRLVPMIRTNLKAPSLTEQYILNLAREFRIPADVQAKLAKVSRSTICRMLGRERKRHTAKGRSAAKPGTLLKQQILVHTFWHWNDKKPGFCEIDTVSHDGGFIQDEYAFTLSLTGVAACWSEFRALRNKAQPWTLQALQDIHNTFPDRDNGASMNTFAILSVFTSFRSRTSSSSLGRPCPGNAGSRSSAAAFDRCIHRYNWFSLTPRSRAIWLTGFSRFSARATAPALNSFVYTRRSFIFFPIFFSSCSIFPAYFCIYQLG